MKSIYRERLARVSASLSKDNQPPAALLLSSAAEIIVSRDTALPFRQDSDFYYLTGSTRTGLLLMLKGGARRPVLYARKSSASEILWNGRAADPKPLAQALGADLKSSDDPLQEARNDLRGVSHLYYQNSPASSGWKIASGLLETPSHLRGDFPKRFSHSDCLLQSLRMHKDAHELKLMEEAIQATCRAYHAVVPLILPGVSEKQIASCVDAAFAMRQCAPCFPTIVAAGSSAAVLHYTSFRRRLKKGELLLIDCGAGFDMYCADMTRTFPVGGKFLSWQKDLYETVLAAQKAAIKRIRHGVTIASVHQAAARALTEGLIDMKVLRGKLSTLMARQACKPFFPHGIGHGLGLDVHDIGPHRGDKQAVLEAGMVITVEPGLYFAKRSAKIPPCGVRIEDDVLVTRQGCRILTSTFPKESREIEGLF